MLLKKTFIATTIRLLLVMFTVSSVRHHNFFRKRTISFSERKSKTNILWADNNQTAKGLLFSQIYHPRHGRTMHGVMTQIKMNAPFF